MCSVYLVVLYYLRLKIKINLNIIFFFNSLKCFLKQNYNEVLGFKENNILDVLIVLMMSLNKFKIGTLTPSIGNKNDFL